MNDTHDRDGSGSALGVEDAAASFAPSRRHFLAISGLAIGGAAIGLGAAGCGTAQTGNQQGTGQAKGRPGAAGETLFVAGFQWGPPTSFNTFAGTIAWPAAQGQSQLIYESLLRFNLHRRIARARPGQGAQGDR